MIFVDLSVISTVSCFSVCKLIGWNPANVFLFKVAAETLEKGVKCPKLTFNTAVSRSGVFNVNFEHISHFLWWFC